MDSVAPLEYFIDPCGGLFPIADLEQRADDIANHVIEEPVRFDFDRQMTGLVEIVSGQNVTGPNVSHRGFPFGAGRFKACEVAMPDDPVGRLSHRVDIDVAADPPAVSMFERISLLTHLQLVAIAFSDGVANRMEIIGGPMDFGDDDRVGQP